MYSHNLTLFVPFHYFLSHVAPYDGIRGVIRLVDSPDDLSRLIANPPKSHITVAMHTTMFNRLTINSLRDNTKLAGVVVLVTSPLNPAGSSPATPTPQLQPATSAQFSDVEVVEGGRVIVPSSKFNRSFVWNPIGDAMREEYYPFAMQLLSVGDTTAFYDRAILNEAALADGEQPRLLGRVPQPVLRLPRQPHMPRQRLVQPSRRTVHLDDTIPIIT